MSSTHTHSFQFTFAKPIGEISEKRIRQIQSNGYELIQHIDGAVAVFKDQDTGNQIILTTNNIAYNVILNQVDKLLADPSIALNAFDKIMDHLLLDGKSILLIQFERSYAVDSGNTLDKSLMLLNDPSDILVEGGYGVGFRIPFKIEHFQGEVKFEPFFNQPNRFFLNCVIQTSAEHNIEEVKKLAPEMISKIFEFEKKAINIFQ